MPRTKHVSPAPIASSDAVSADAGFSCSSAPMVTDNAVVVAIPASLVKSAAKAAASSPEVVSGGSATCGPSNGAITIGPMLLVPGLRFEERTSVRRRASGGRTGGSAEPASAPNRAPWRLRTAAALRMSAFFAQCRFGALPHRTYEPPAAQSGIDRRTRWSWQERDDDCYTYRAHRRFGNGPRADAFDILDARYAKGDLTRDEYALMKSEILSRT